MKPAKNITMDAQTIIILIGIGIVAGILSGMVGIGGGIVIVPALVYLLGFSQFKAQGTSLGLLMLPVGFLAVLQFYKQGHVDFKVVLMIAAGFILGSFMGGKLTLAMPQETVKKIFAVIMLLISLKMLFLDKKKPETQQQSATEISGGKTG